MELKDILYQMMADNQAAQQPTDLVIGTVVGVNPLQISINTEMAPLISSVLYLAEPVIEKKISLLSHTHTVNGNTTSTALSSVAVTENGTALPTDSAITINKGLQVGDKCLLLRVQHGQKFIVLSRVYEVV